MRITLSEIGKKDRAKKSRFYERVIRKRRLLGEGSLLGMLVFLQE